MTASSSSQTVSPTSIRSYPFANAVGQIEVLPNGIDVEEESRLYDQLDHDPDWSAQQASQKTRYGSPPVAPSIMSRESIWLGDSTGQSQSFARDVKIGGWTDVGDKNALGSYIVYDCVITTKERTVIHAHKRYNAFCQLESTLRRTVPSHQQHFIPELPPKSALARYRPVFLNRRRTQLQHWLASVLLHPEIGASKAVRNWVLE
ncbi:Phox-like protein [Pterulicium gracile]|uniref:Endosomal/vacuolar adapter protein YPT35 n=1 Tax=Pterulicium gracile TaxID=1884261 RepID=A0A5C3QCN9_9AGAR|nr:Phox-like protein [Pterula gracilis]